MRFLTYILLFSSLLFSEKIELKDFYSANSKSKFYYDAVLSCDEVKNVKSLVQIEISKMDNYSKQPKSYGYEWDISQVFNNIEYQNLEERLENLKSLEKERCIK